MEPGRVRCIEITDDEALEAVYRLRYAVYVGEMGRRQAYADHATRRLVEPLDRNALHVAAYAEPGDRLAPGVSPLGALRLSLAARGGLETIERIYGLEPGRLGARSMVITRLVTRPEARGGAASAGLALAKAAFRIGLRESIEEGFIDCNAHLVPLFEWLGFDVIRRFTHADYGEIAVLRIDALDRARLVRSDSPFLPILDAATSSDRSRRSAEEASLVS